MKTAAKATVDAVMADHASDVASIARRGNNQRTMAFVPRSHAYFTRLASEMSPIDGEIAGIMIVETLVLHPDALSVTGRYLKATGDRAPKSKLIYVRANGDGTPSLDYLCRDGGALDLATRGAWA